jgi:hypothetical protein
MTSVKITFRIDATVGLIPEQITKSFRDELFANVAKKVCSKWTLTVTESDIFAAFVYEKPVEVISHRGLTVTKNQGKNLRNFYSIEAEQLIDIMLDRARQQCQCCGKFIKLSSEDKSQRAMVDHDHKTGLLRGVVCPSCNLRIGRSEREGKAATHEILAYLAFPPLRQLNIRLDEDRIERNKLRQKLNKEWRSSNENHAKKLSRERSRRYRAKNAAYSEPSCSA